MVCEAVEVPLVVAVTATGRPTCTPPTKKVTAPLGEQLGAAWLQLTGVTVVVTVNGTGYWGEPVAGLVMTVADVVAVTISEMPLKVIDGAGAIGAPPVKAVVPSENVAVCGPRVLAGALKLETSRQLAPGLKTMLLLDEQPEPLAPVRVNAVLEGAGVKRPPELPR